MSKRESEKKELPEEEEEEEYNTEDEEEDEEEEEEYIGDTDDSDLSENDEKKTLGIDSDTMNELDDTIELSDEEEDVVPVSKKSKKVVREPEPFDEKLYSEYLKRKPNETLHHFKARNMIAGRLRETKIGFQEIPVVVECILNQCCGAQYSQVLTDYINSLK